MDFERGSAPFLVPSNKPQLHSRKCHHTYNATRSLPIAVWIRSLRFGLDRNHNHSSRASDDGSSDDGSDFEDDEETALSRGVAALFMSSSCKEVVYEIVLYYDHNRACTIYRTPEDFAKLKEAVGPAKYRRWVQQRQQQQQQQQKHNKQQHHRRHHAGSDSEDDEEMFRTHHHGLAPLPPVVDDVEDLQHFLSQTISRKGRDCVALEYFLRRRMDDCGGQ